VTDAAREGAGSAVRDPALDELLQKYREGNLVLFAGAGVSAAAGLPSWGRLASLLAERARTRGAAREVLGEIEALAKAGRFIDALTAAKDAIGPAEFGEIVEASLDDRKVLAVPEVGQAIASLAGGLRAVLTTNIDHLLERAFQGRWPALHRATGNMARRHGVILKLHGTLLDRGTWVFTRDEYDRAMYADPLLKEAFSAIFHTCPILFVGYGLADDDFDQILGRVRALAGGQAARHFALVAEESITTYWRKVREDAGVRVIGYRNEDGRHAEVLRVLRWLGEPDSAPPVVPEPRSTATTTATATGVSRSTAMGPPPPPDAPYDRSFYIHRAEEEERALAKLAMPGTPVVLWGPWLSGKSTMLRYLLERVQEADAEAGKQSLFLEADLLDLLRPLRKPATSDGLLERFARNLRKEARVDESRFEKLAKSRQGWSDKLIELMEDHVLPAARGRVVLVVDKADAVWGLGKVQGAFYGALRHWKERANRPAWSNLRLILLLSTTPSLVFEDPDHADSPFANLTNDVIELLDLAHDQVVELARMHGLDWGRGVIDRHVYPLLGGQPYLLRALMHRAWLRTHRGSAPIEGRGDALDALVGDPEALDRLFGDHLGELGRLLERDAGLQRAVRRVLDDPRAPLDEDHFQRLQRAGLVTRGVAGEHRIRCELYERSLRRRWKIKQPAR
jgi:hypothetical protein